MAEVLADTNPFSVSPQYYKDLIRSFAFQFDYVHLQNPYISLKNGIVSVGINASDLISFDPAFAYLLIQHPGGLMPLVEETFKECFQQQKTIPGVSSFVCKVRIFNLPAVPELSKLSIGSIINSTTSLVQLVGTVVRTGGIRMLELSKKFQCLKRSCQKEFCIFADPEQGFLLPRPTRCPAVSGIEGNQNRCNSTDFRELPDGAQCVDYQEIKVYDKIEHISLGNIPRSITVLLLNTLVDAVSPGDDVILTGTILRQWKPPCKGFRCNVDVVIQASHISRFSKNFVRSLGLVGNHPGMGRHSPTFVRSKDILNIDTLISDLPTPFPRCFRDLLSKILEKASRNASTDVESYIRNMLMLRKYLVSSVCPETCGLYSAKLCLLLATIGGSLDTIGSDNIIQDNDNKNNSSNNNNNCNNGSGEGKRRNNIHLLLVGDPGSGKSQLLRFAGEMVDRSVLTTGVGTTGAGLTCSAHRDSSFGGMSNSEWSLEAGALVLASGGVCCIDEFGTMKEHDRAAIHEALEQQTISVAKAGLIVKLNCQCSVLAASNLKGKFDVSLSLSQNTNIAPPLLSRFDLILVLVDRPDRNWDKQVSTFLLKQHTHQTMCNKNSNAEIISPQSLKEYIAYVKNIHPRLSPEAFDLLNAFYGLQRKQLRGGSVRLLESLIRVSQAHARMLFRDVVCVFDAISAIDLVSQSLQHHFEAQLFSSLVSSTTASVDSGIGEDPSSVDPLMHYCEVRRKIMHVLSIRHTGSYEQDFHSSNQSNSHPHTNNRSKYTENVNVSFDVSGDRLTGVKRGFDDT